MHTPIATKTNHQSKNGKKGIFSALHIHWMRDLAQKKVHTHHRDFFCMVLEINSMRSFIFIPAFLNCQTIENLPAADVAMRKDLYLRPKRERKKSTIHKAKSMNFIWTQENIHLLQVSLFVYGCCDSVWKQVAFICLRFLGASSEFWFFFHKLLNNQENPCLWQKT